MILKKEGHNIIMNNDIYIYIIMNKKDEKENY